jgi:hypothetical protein
VYNVDEIDGRRKRNNIREREREKSNKNIAT